MAYEGYSNWLAGPLNYVRLGLAHCAALRTFLGAADVAAAQASIRKVGFSSPSTGAMCYVDFLPERMSEMVAGGAGGVYQESGGAVVVFEPAQITGWSNRLAFDEAIVNFAVVVGDIWQQFLGTSQQSLLDGDGTTYAGLPAWTRVQLLEGPVVDDPDTEDRVRVRVELAVYWGP